MFSFTASSIARAFILMALAVGFFTTLPARAQSLSNQFLIPGSSISFVFMERGLAVYDGQKYVHLDLTANRIPLENSRLSEAEPSRAWVFGLDDNRVLVAFEGGSAVISPHIKAQGRLRASFVIDALGTRFVVISQLSDGSAVWLIGRAKDGRLMGDSTGSTLAKLNLTLEQVVRSIELSPTDLLSARDANLEVLFVEPATLKTFDPLNTGRGFTMQNRAVDSWVAQISQLASGGRLVSNAEFAPLSADLPVFARHYYLGGFHVVVESGRAGHRVSVEFGTPGEVRSTVWRTGTLRVQTRFLQDNVANAEAAVFVFDGDIALALLKNGTAMIVRPSASPTQTLNSRFARSRDGARYFIFSQGGFVQSIVAVAPDQSLMRQNFTYGKLRFADANLNLSEHSFKETERLYKLRSVELEILNPPYFESQVASRLTFIDGGNQVEPRGPVDSLGPLRREPIPGSPDLSVASFRNGWVAVFREGPVGSFTELLTLENPPSVPHPRLRRRAGESTLPASIVPSFTVSRGDLNSAPSLTMTRAHVIYGSGSDQRSIAYREIFGRLSGACQSFTRKEAQ